MKCITKYLFPLALAILASCAAEDPADSPREITSTDMSSITIPAELQAHPTPETTCTSEGNACVSISICNANGGRGVSGTGCATGLTCCSFNQCTNAGNACTGLNLCNANGGHSVALSGCASGLVCCSF